MRLYHRTTFENANNIKTHGFYKSDKDNNFGSGVYCSTYEIKDRFRGFGECELEIEIEDSNIKTIEVKELEKIVGDFRDTDDYAMRNNIDVLCV